MNAADPEKSARLQRLLAALKACKGTGIKPTTLDLVVGAQICAVSAAVSELRQAGHNIECTKVGRHFHYELLS